MPRTPVRFIAAWSFLGLMALVITPRELLHRCEAQSAHHGEQREGPVITAVCGACDAALPVATAIGQELEGVPAITRVLMGDEALREAMAPAVMSCADRGPPARS